MGIVVQKYGGTSVGTIEKIKNVARHVANRKNQGDDVVVVVSAMGDSTDDLIDLASKISDHPNKREMDALLATGEMVSSSLLAMALNEMGVPAVSFNAYQIQLLTNGDHGRSTIEDIDTEPILNSLKSGKVVVVCGFQGISGDMEITTLGRGGSDTSAVAIAVKLHGVSEIYTDVDGIYSVDPRLYTKAKKLSEISYEEMLELSSLGAQVMHSRSVELAEKYSIPIYVGRSCSDIKGTYIKEVKNMENKTITGIAASDNDAAITIKNLKFDIMLLADIFQAIADKKISIDMISQTSPIDGEVNVSFTVPLDSIEECMSVLKRFTSEKYINVDRDVTKFSVVGIGMKNTPGVTGRLFKLFSDNGIQVKLITTSEIRITCAINQEDKLKAIKLVAEAFNL